MKEKKIAGILHILAIIYLVCLAVGGLAGGIVLMTTGDSLMVFFGLLTIGGGALMGTTIWALLEGASRLVLNSRYKGNGEAAESADDDKAVKKVVHYKSFDTPFDKTSN